MSEDHVADDPFTAVNNVIAATSCTTTGTEDSDTVILQVVPL